MSLDRVIKTAQKCPKRPFSATKCLHWHVSPPHNASARRPPHTAKRSGARLRGPMPRCGGASDAPRPGATAKVRSALPACRARAPARIARAAARPPRPAPSYIAASRLPCNVAPAARALTPRRGRCRRALTPRRRRRPAPPTQHAAAATAAADVAAVTRRSTRAAAAAGAASPLAARGVRTTVRAGDDFLRRAHDRDGTQGQELDTGNGELLGDVLARREN